MAFCSSFQKLFEYPLRVSRCFSRLPDISRTLFTDVFRKLLLAFSIFQTFLRLSAFRYFTFNINSFLKISSLVNFLKLINHFKIFRNLFSVVSFYLNLFATSFSKLFTVSDNFWKSSASKNSV